ncbi:MAG: HAMP domain-containing protein [Deltaproteobacteria bacterium]|nr:HAMP domain-containing protein [Deltaproteobacteria bacterium]
MRIHLKRTQSQRKGRRWLRETAIVLLLLLLIALLTYLQTHVSTWGGQLPLPRNVLVFALISFHIVLLLLLVFLVLRNLVKLVFDRRKKILGARLRTKLVLAFICLSLVPTVLLFFTATHFLSRSIEDWFSIQMEGSLQQSLVVAQLYYQNTSHTVLHHARQIARNLGQQRLLEPGQRGLLTHFLEGRRGEYGLAAVEVFSGRLLQPVRVYGPDLPAESLPPLESKILEGALQGKEVTKIQWMDRGDLIRGLVPIFSPVPPREVIGVVVVNYHVPQSLVARIGEISSAFEEYKQLKVLKNPIKFSYLVTLSLVTLLIVFSATWFGLFLAKGITEPIQDLARATEKITQGDLDFQIPKSSRDEIGTLVDSFNQMTRDLKGSKRQVERAHAELSKSNLELEQRRRYMEIVLRDVGAGVISIDSGGRIRTLNRSAERILGLAAEEALAKSYAEVLPAALVEPVEKLAQVGPQAESQAITRQIKLPGRQETLALMVKVAFLRDEENRPLGFVLVLDDLTQLQKAQRAAAWREVARRIAHEIKNPLTPIQLSAQRLRKRYLHQFGEDGAVFDECTRTIVTQVEELKTLVNEFSSFARMPAAHPTPNDLNGIIREAMVLYEEGHKQVQFEWRPDERIPIFHLDKDQIKRAIMNLLDNAVAAVESVEPADRRIAVETHLDPAMRLARIEVADAGCGVPPEDKPLLFEPYFSRKASGTGLGLAIVSTIVSDHDGYIRVKDNAPRGTRFIIEMPVKT